MDTQLLLNNVEKAKTILELEVELDKYLNEESVEWSEKLKKLMAEKNITKLQLKKELSISDTTLKTLVKQLPKRERILQICVVLQLSVDETNLLLSRTGKTSVLYIKNPNDAIYIYLLINKLPYKEFATCKKYLDGVLKRHSKPNKSSIKNNDTFWVNQKMYETLKFEKFVDEHLDAFFTRNEKINDYIKTTNSNILRFSSKKLSRLKSLKPKEIFVPNRDDLIALGICYGFTVENINEMLEITHNEKLCPKHIDEAIVIFVLKELFRYCPNQFVEYNEEKDYFDIIENIKSQNKNIKFDDFIKKYVSKKCSQNGLEVIDILFNMSKEDAWNLVPNYLAERSAMFKEKYGFIQSDLYKNILNNLIAINKLF